MNWSRISKAIAGATAGALSAGTLMVVVPEAVLMPWYGYVIVGAINASLGFAAVYIAPANRP